MEFNLTDDIFRIKFNQHGLIPAIVQDAESKSVLMLAYMNAESIKLTLGTGYAHYYSRSRNNLWKKGETSGHLQEIVSIALDCDLDTILLTVNQIGGIACHTGAPSCFFRQYEKIEMSKFPIWPQIRNNFKTDMKLTHIKKCLDMMDNPQNNLKNVIHVAGTNGKGSTIAFIRAFYEASGYRVNAYTSPHLVYFNERIYLGGRYISNIELEEIVAEVMPCDPENKLTFFEATTLLAICAFRKYPADINLIETGLGGRLDATNIFENSNKIASVITPIGFDHQEYLGSNLESIASEKAGIIKQSNRVILGDMELPLQDFFSQYCIEKNIDYNTTTSYSFKRAKNLKLSLVGEHQISNAATAIQVTESLKDILPIDSNAITQGANQVQHPGRLTKITNWNLGICGDVWIDGAHNTHAIQEIVKFFSSKLYDQFNIILAISKSKDIENILNRLIPIEANRIFITSIDDDYVMNSEELFIMANQIFPKNTEIFFTHNPTHAFQQIQLIQNAPLNSQNECTLILGSLYLVGHIYEYFAPNYSYYGKTSSE